MASMRAWVIRAGDGGASVDEFVDGGFVGLAYDAVGDLRRFDRWTIERILEDEGISPVDVHASTLISFQHEVFGGDLVVLPDPSRSEVAAGVVTGAYDHASYLPEGQHRHRRGVEWLARHPRADLPAVLAEVQRQRVAIRRVDSPSLEAYVADLRAGSIGRPADQKVAPRAARAPRASAGSSPRRAASPRRTTPAAPRKAEVATRRCDGCYQTKPVTQFDDDGPFCRDCA